MRTVFVICPLLLGAAVALVNCGGDDTSPAGGTTGGSGGTGGATGGGAGAGGASGGMDGGTTGGAGGTAGAAGSSGKGGASGAAGAAGSSGKGGASGAAGSGGKAGAAGAAGAGGKAGAAGAAGSGMTDGGPTMCPATQPAPTDACNSQEDCRYGAVTCTCIDPGPDGRWGCSGGPLPEGGPGGDGGMCPATEPRFGDPCSDAGFLGPCIYDSGHAECRCDPDTGGWGCIRH